MLDGRGSLLQAWEIRLHMIGNGETLKVVGESYKYAPCKYHVLATLLAVKSESLIDNNARGSIISQEIIIYWNYLDQSFHLPGE